MSAFSFRRVVRSDFPLLARWLAEPHVARWWHHEFTPEAVERDFGPSVDGAEPNEDHLVLHHEQPIGLIQYSRYTGYPEYLEEVSTVYPVGEGAVSIDYLIGDPVCVGRGIGAAMIVAFTERIWATDPSARCVVVPVASANEASWRALLRAGFRVVAQGWLEPDNPIDDGAHHILRVDRPG